MVITYILDIFISYAKFLKKRYSDLQFLPEGVNINKCQKHVCSMYDKKNDFVYIKTLKLILDYRIILEKGIGYSNLIRKASSSLRTVLFSEKL